MNIDIVRDPFKLRIRPDESIAAYNANAGIAFLIDFASSAKAIIEFRDEKLKKLTTRDKKRLFSMIQDSNDHEIDCTITGKIYPQKSKIIFSKICIY